MSLLVHTPAPMATESLLGYVLRVSEGNGYASPTHLFVLAELGRGQDQIPGFPYEKIAKIVGRRPEELSAIAYRLGSGRSARFKILNHDLGRSLVHTPLRLRQPALCPVCVETLGYIDAFWDLRAAVACPEHQTTVLRACPTCGAGIRWRRPGLLKCPCGATLSPDGLQCVDGVTVELMRALRDKLHGNALSAVSNPSAFPIEALERIPLRALLYLLEVLGTYMLRSRREGTGDWERTIAAAAQILADWPRNYHRMLANLGNHFLEQDPSAMGLRRQFRPFYETLFKNGSVAAYMGFFKEEFIAFGIHHWGRAFIDKKLLRERDKTAARFVSKSELARRHRLWRPTLNRLTASGAIVAKKVGTGKRARTVVDLERSQLPVPSSGVITIREAGRKLGLPVSVLEYLRDTGVFPVKPRTGRHSSWHLDDVEAFRLRALHLPQDHSYDGSAVSLKNLMRLKPRSAAAKASIVAGMLDGRIAVVGREGPTLGDLLLHKEQVEAVLTEQKILVHGGTCTLPEAAARTGLDPAVVPRAVEAALLESIKSGGPIRISLASIERFNQMYVPLARLVKVLGSSSAGLWRRCRDNAIPVITLQRPNGGPVQPIVSREAAHRLKCLYEAEVAEREERRQTGREARYLRAFHEYCDRLRTTGGRLPRRGGKPNKFKIAKACGFGRHVFDCFRAVMTELEQYDREEQQLLGRVVRDAVGALRQYLDELRNSGRPLPRWCGKVNKLAISRACGFSRAEFYKNREVSGLIERHVAEEAGTGGDTVVMSAGHRAAA